MVRFPASVFRQFRMLRILHLTGLVIHKLAPLVYFMSSRSRCLPSTRAVRLSLRSRLFERAVIHKPAYAALFHASPTQTSSCHAASPENTFPACQHMQAAALVPSRSSPRPISDSQLQVLPHFHLCPIYLVVSKGSYWIPPGISHLKGGFTLRCLQRLSLPDLATQPCHWYDNWYTSGPSSPVLSY